MKILYPLTILAALLLPPAPLGAQWLDYPTAGAPKNRDGSPNLNAPVSRTVSARTFIRKP